MSLFCSGFGLSKRGRGRPLNYHAHTLALFAKAPLESLTENRHHEKRFLISSRRSCVMRHLPARARNRNRNAAANNAPDDLLSRQAGGPSTGRVGARPARSHCPSPCLVSWHARYPMLELAEVLASDMRFRNYPIPKRQEKAPPQRQMLRYSQVHSRGTLARRVSDSSRCSCL